MSFFAADPDGLLSTGSSAARLSPQAASVATKALHGYDSAAQAVGHPVLAAAFRAFGDAHAALHHSLGPEVAKAGASLAKGANALSSGQNDATAVQRSSASTGEETVEATRTAVR